MVSFFGVEDRSLEFYNHLTQDWRIKSEYVMPFLSEYKKEISKRYKSGMKRFERLERMNPEFSDSLKMIDEHGFKLDHILVEQACITYKRDFMRGKHIGTNIETMVWAILIIKIEDVKKFDPLFASYIKENILNYIPDLMELLDV